MNKLEFDVKSLEEVSELIERSSVEIVGRDDVIPGIHSEGRSIKKSRSRSVPELA